MFRTITPCVIKSIYSSGFDDGDIKGLTVTKDSKTPQHPYGTSFFISKDGQIETDAHVVSNTATDQKGNDTVANIMGALNIITAASHKLDLITIEYNYAKTSADVSFEYFLIVKKKKE